jgi:Protein of unknown function (DUF4019)
MLPGASAVKKEKTMKLAVAFLCTALLMMFLPQTMTTQAQQKPEDLAQKSAEAWLALTDSNKYPESWDEASSFFKSKITKDTWTSKLQQTRGPLGALKSRKLASAKYIKNPPNAPEGEFVILTFDSSFDQLPSSTETVSMALDKDGKWRAAGYYIKPAGM